MPDSKKKFNIRPFRQHTPMDRTDANATWKVLADAMDEIANRNASRLSFEEVYRNAYNLVLHKHGALLYDGVTAKINEILSKTVENLSEQPNETLLEAVATAWQDHSVTMRMIRDILMYMDRTFVKQDRRRPVYELGLHLFQLTVWDHPNVGPRVLELVLESIRQQRVGEREDRDARLPELVRMLIELGQADYVHNVYTNFETLFLSTSLEFYQRESMEVLSNGTASDYVQKARQRLEQETKRASQLKLPPSTEDPLKLTLETEWIVRHAKTLVDMPSGFSAMLGDQTKLDALQDMFDLFARVRTSVDFLRDALSVRVKQDGKSLVQDQEKGNVDPSSFCRSVLSMKDKYDTIIKHSFRNEPRANKRCRESFEDFLNQDARAASCLATYVDELLRVGLRGATELQVDNQLGQAIVIFRYLQDKDVFESFYKQHLAKRLLGGRSVSDDAERTMVSLLKAECGYQFTTKLEGMFNDMRISKETREKYKKEKKKGVVDIDVNVLTTGNWPSQSVPSCTLPPQVQDSIDSFSKFYLETYTGRKLKWQTSVGSAEIKATFGQPPNLRRHDLSVSTYQMCILLLFNDTDTLTLGQIRQHTHIPDAELRRHLISLSTPKNRILKKASKGRGITSDSDSFTYNHEYTSKHKKVRIPLIKETSMAQSASAAVVPVAVEEDRRHLVEAAIVRIMKARKSLNHNDLIAEVSRQLSNRFTPAPVFIKKRVESLIEREYLERAEGEHRLYNYVA